MAKTKTSSSKSSLRTKKTKADYVRISLSKKNYLIIGIGILVIVLGYIFMSENSVDGVMPTVIAPIFLVAGYCVIIPFGILYKDKTDAAQQEIPKEEAPKTAV